ncbi:MAG: EI24 domain-containing protein [Betaproteobacteria bacterium]|nr:EI24 domain-containing protein [Betaproteobacteria bacterium]
MNDITQALARAGGGLMHPKMLLLMIWPLALSLILWVVLGLAFGVQLSSGIEAFLNQSSLYQSVTAVWPVSLIATGLLWILMILLAIPLVLMTATLVIGVLAMPIVVNHVAAKSYPNLARKQGGSILGSVWNALAALLWLSALIIMTLPLWLIPLFWPLIPVVLLGYLNQRVFRYDALAEHGSREEINQVVASSKGRLMGLGIALGAIGHIPLVGFFTPVYGALAFTYFSLERLVSARHATLVPSPQ